MKITQKLTLDIIMTIIMIILMGYTVSGALIHEILGISVLILIVMHNVINIKWISAIIKNKSKSLNYKIYLKLIINILMTINSIFLAVTSIVISRNLFAFLNISHSRIWTSLHGLSAYVEIAMISIHVGLHWSMIMNVFRNIFNLKSKSAIRTASLRIIAFLLAALGVKASFSRGITLNLPSNEKSDLKNADNIKAGTASNSTKSDDNLNSLKEENSSISDKIVRTKGGPQGGTGGKKSHGNVDRSFEGTAVSDGESLGNFLGRLTCTGCGKRCLLSNPQCSTGDAQAASATAYYESYTSGNSADENAVSPSFQGTSPKDNKIIFEFESPRDDSLLSLFSDYVPIMGMYIAGTYYVLEIIDKTKKK